MAIDIAVVEAGNQFGQRDKAGRLGLAARTLWQLARMFICPGAPPLFRRRLDFGLERALDGNGSGCHGW
jgi:hypothetical protein